VPCSCFEFLRLSVACTTQNAVVTARIYQNILRLVFHLICDLLVLVRILCILVAVDFISELTKFESIITSHKFKDNYVF